MFLSMKINHSFTYKPARPGKYFLLFLALMILASPTSAFAGRSGVTAATAEPDTAAHTIIMEAAPSDEEILLAATATESDASEVPPKETTPEEATLEQETPEQETSEQDVLEGWQGSRYYINGVPVTGLRKIEGKYYYFDENGCKTCRSWIRFDGGKSYFDGDGVRVNGWQSIKGRYYYFKKYFLQTNTIAGTKKTGQYYVASDGVRIDDAAMNRAVKFVLKYSKTSDSDLDCLKSCVNQMLENQYIHMSTPAPAASDLPSYANYLLKNKKGNCYRFASAMCYIARALGYSSRMTAGWVTSSSSASNMAHHGWAEVKIDGKWYVMDITMQRKHTEKLTFVTRKKYPYKYRVDYLYSMTAKKGEITWSRKKQ